MITNINKLTSFGIFHDYKPDKDLKIFEQYNLFYGWNGSGKSTLTKLFLSLTDKKTHSHFDQGEYSLLSNTCPEITHKNVASNTVNIQVFNRDFIERNVNFEQSKANSILILSEEKQEDLLRYKDALSHLDSKQKEHRTSVALYDKRSEELKKNLSKWASNVKKSFELIETSNSYYLNYDRTKIVNFIKNCKESLNQSSILNIETVTELKNIIKPNRKPDVDIEQFSLVETDEIIIKTKELQSALSQSIYSQQILRLVNHPELNMWVERGLNLHNELNDNICEFCNQVLPTARIEELNNHFSQSYKTLIGTLKTLSDYLQVIFHRVKLSFTDPLELYEEIQGEYFNAKKTHLNNVQNCHEILRLLIAEVERKTQNPFEIITISHYNIKAAFDDINDSLTGMCNLVIKHNFKNQKFDDIVKKAQNDLELHFVSEQLVSNGYENLENEIKEIEKERNELASDVTISKEIVLSFEASLLNEAIGADKFNKSLAKFLGRSDIRIEFDKQLKGYKLIRGYNTTPASNLSEGEKTAIAFVYFISKLKENGNQIQNTIVVLDDPISSFDSNHLFHSYSYLKLECEKAEQLFILTHNFQYFKLIRDWLLKKNEVKTINGQRVEKTRSRFYAIECTNSDNRQATIKNANDTLIKYNSEYHYVFSKLNLLKDATNLDIEKAFLISNLSRKLLEAFLTFKFPKGRNDFSQLLQSGCAEAETREKVYRFINKYSHNQEIDFHDTPIDNLLGEGDNIVREVFKIIQELDSTHYEEMQELAI